MIGFGEEAGIIYIGHREFGFDSKQACGTHRNFAWRPRKHDMEKVNDSSAHQVYRD